LRLGRPLNISLFSKRSVCVPEMCKKENYLFLNCYIVLCTTKFRTHKTTRTYSAKLLSFLSLLCAITVTTVFFCHETYSLGRFFLTTVKRGNRCVVSIPEPELDCRVWISLVLKELGNTLDVS
jgi:hypothetical protein